MFRHLLTACAIVCLALSLHAADGKKRGKNKKAQKPVDADQLQPGVFSGRLIAPPDPGGDFVVSVAVPRLVPKKGAKGKNANQISRLQQQIQQEAARASADAANNRNPAPRLNRIQRLQAQLQQAVARAGTQSGGALQSYSVKTDWYPVQFHAATDMKVRLREPGEAFTEKGDIKQFTPAELKKLKGKNPTLPGFEGGLADLKADLIVQVLQKRPMPVAKGKDAATESVNAHKNIASVIMVLGEGEPQGKKRGESKKK